MKRLMIALMFVPALAAAEVQYQPIEGITIVPAYASVSHKFSADETFKKIWDEYLKADYFHLLDNASAVTFKDLGSRRWYAGTSTYVYKRKYLTIDFNVLKPLDTSSSLLPGAGASFQLGSFLYHDIDFVKTITDRVGKTAPMIYGANIGIGYARNFSTGKNMFMLYGGVVSKFGGGGK